MDHTFCYEFDGLSKINTMIEKLSPLSDISYVLDDQNEESVNSSDDSYYYNQYYTGEGVRNLWLILSIYRKTPRKTTSPTNTNPTIHVFRDRYWTILPILFLPEIQVYKIIPFQSLTRLIWSPFRILVRFNLVPFINRRTVSPGPLKQF